MRLLVVSQKVDKKDPILGFFHHWLEELSGRFEDLVVICLEEGEHNLPGNVRVLSLGKEKGGSKLKYLKNFYKYIWNERKNYDGVFVHMNQEYVLLGWKFWKLWGKKIYLWRNHPEGSWLTRMSVTVSNKVFCTSKQSYTARFKKTKIMPVGIDEDIYKGREQNQNNNNLLFFGRLSTVKNVHIFIHALSILNEGNADFRADIIGSPTDERGKEYENKLHEIGNDLVRAGKLAFKPAISPDENITLYAKYDLYVNLTPDGSFDKTILEAAASAVPVLASNSALRGVVDGRCYLPELEPKVVSGRIKEFLGLDISEKNKIGQELREFVVRSHSLKQLVSLLEAEMTQS